MKWIVGLCCVVFVLASTQDVSRTCLFVTGPRTGQTQTYPNAKPIALGSSCQDDTKKSLGFAILDSGARGKFSMSGDNPGCMEIAQIPVPYLPNENIPKSGLATFSGANPIIFLRTSQLPSFPTPVRIYLYGNAFFLFFCSFFFSFFCFVFSGLSHFFLCRFSPFFLFFLLFSFLLFFFCLFFGFFFLNFSV